MILTELCSFLWAIFQLQLLRQSSSLVHGSLDDLPKNLDETYDRILKGIAQKRQAYAQCLFQCLSVSVRPLRVEELAYILPIYFGVAANHKFIANSCPNNPEQTIFSVCRSLISIIDMDGSQGIQFSHSSVKEYLKSERLANAGEPLSQYHILPHSAHALLAEVSLHILLAIDVQVGKIIRNISFVTYAAQYWVEHAQFGYVSPRVKCLMERLFDHSKPHFATWVWIYDIDHPFRERMHVLSPTPPEAVPLYYAVLCGIRGLVEHLIFTCPQDINARGGYYGTPLHAAIAKENVGVTTLLLERGVDVAALNNHRLTPLHKASQRGNIDLMKLLHKHHAQINARDGDGRTSLSHTASEGFLDGASFLLRNGASVDSRNNCGWTPLMFASQGGHLDVVQLLLQNGATADSRNNNRWTSLMLASRGGHLDVVRLLLRNGATADSLHNPGMNPLMLASRNEHLDVVLLLLRNGATLDPPDGDGWTALMSVSQTLDAVLLSLKNGGTLDFRDDRGWTPLMAASQGGHIDVMRSLLRNGAAIDSCDHGGWTPLMAASQGGHMDVVHVLIQGGAAVDFRDDGGWTPLMVASQAGHKDVVRLLIQSGAAVDSRDNCGCTPLMPASHGGYLEVVRLLLKSGAIADSYDDYGWTPLMSAIQGGHADIVRLLLDSGAAVNGCRNDHWTSSSSMSRHLPVAVQKSKALSYLLTAQIHIQTKTVSAPLSISHPPMAISPLLSYSFATAQRSTCRIRTKKHRCALHHIMGSETF
jgi:ankyrin repeat protein